MTAEVNISLNFRNKIPISDQVQEEMRRLIQEGILRPGDQLPTVRILAAQLKVNFNTIARAYRILDHEGLISTQQGRGTYVLEPATEGEGQRAMEIEAAGTMTKEEWAEILISEMIEKANRHEISMEEILHVLERRVKPGQKKTAAHRRLIRTSSKKPVYTPTGERAAVRIKSGPGLRRPRKARK